MTDRIILLWLFLGFLFLAGDYFIFQNYYAWLYLGRARKEHHSPFGGWRGGRGSRIPLGFDSRKGAGSDFSSTAFSILVLQDSAFHHILPLLACLSYARRLSVKHPQHFLLATAIRWRNLSRKVIHRHLNE